jgi:hypothetical protein
MSTQRRRPTRIVKPSARHYTSAGRGRWRRPPPPWSHGSTGGGLTGIWTRTLLSQEALTMLAGTVASKTGLRLGTVTPRSSVERRRPDHDRADLHGHCALQGDGNAKSGQPTLHGLSRRCPDLLVPRLPVARQLGRSRPPPVLQLCLPGPLQLRRPLGVRRNRRRPTQTALSLFGLCGDLCPLLSGTGGLRHRRPPLLAAAASRAPGGALFVPGPAQSLRCLPSAK